MRFGREIETTHSNNNFQLEFKIERMPFICETICSERAGELECCTQCNRIYCSLIVGGFSVFEWFTSAFDTAKKTCLCHAVQLHLRTERMHRECIDKFKPIIQSLIPVWNMYLWIYFHLFICSWSTGALRLINLVARANRLESISPWPPVTACWWEIITIFI